MTNRRLRVLSATALSAAALALAAPGVAQAGGTDDPKYDHPPTSSSPAPERVQQCDESTNSGHGGVTRTAHELGRSGPTSFVFTYDTYTVPDQIEVTYEGQTVFTTDGFIGTQGDRSETISLPAGSADYVTVVVTGNPSQSTDWDYKVSCPS